MENRYTQEQLSEMLCMTQANYSKLENNHIDASIEIIMKLAEIFKKDVKDFLPQKSE